MDGVNFPEIMLIPPLPGNLHVAVFVMYLFFNEDLVSEELSLAANLLSKLKSARDNNIINSQNM